MSSIHRGYLDAGLYAPLTQHLGLLGSGADIVGAVTQLLDVLAKNDLLSPEAGVGVHEEPVVHRATVKLPMSERVFAIPDSELKIWESGAKVAALYFGASATDGLEKVAGGLLTAFLGGMFVALIAAWKKHAILPEDQGALLLALKRRPNSTVEGLLMHLPDDLELSVERATAALEGLKSVRLANGKELALVNAQDGRWWAVDV